MLLSDYIKVLQTTLEATGDKEVVITESGYYSEWKFAADIYDVPKIEVKEGLEVYSLGHSSQSY